MPKLLSRSKHEEFKSNSTLQIKDQKERRAKCEEKHHCRKASPASTVPASQHCASCNPLFSCISRTFCFCYNFWFFSFLPLFYPLMFGLDCISLSFVRLHKPILYTLSRDGFFAVNKVRVPVLPFFSLFSHFLSLSRLPNTPLRMTTQRMFG